MKISDVVVVTHNPEFKPEGLAVPYYLPIDCSADLWHRIIVEVWKTAFADGERDDEVVCGAFNGSVCDKHLPRGFAVVGSEAVSPWVSTTAAKDFLTFQELNYLKWIGSANFNQEALRRSAAENWTGVALWNHFLWEDGKCLEVPPTAWNSSDRVSATRYRYFRENFPVNAATVHALKTRGVEP